MLAGIVAAAALLGSGRATGSPRSVSFQITSSATAHTIANAYGVGAHASGVFLVLELVARNDAAQAESLSRVGLELGGDRYALDGNALAALELTGKPALPALLAAGASASGWVVFDVPMGALPAKPRLCLGAHGCIS